MRYQSGDLVRMVESAAGKDMRWHPPKGTTGKVLKVSPAVGEDQLLVDWNWRRGKTERMVWWIGAQSVERICRRRRRKAEQREQATALIISMAANALMVLVVVALLMR